MKNIFLLIICLISCSSLSCKTYKPLHSLGDKIIRVEIHYNYSLNSIHPREKDVLNDRKIVVRKTSKIKKIISSVNFDKQLIYKDNATHRVPDIDIFLYLKKGFLRLRLWEYENKLLLATLDKNGKEYYFEGINNNLKKILLKYYKQIIRFSHSDKKKK